jgi:L-seryl-tRNA(Ser) seleniumtransferase
MATTPLPTLDRRARAGVAAAGHGRVATTSSVPGGGTLPGVEIPSVGITVAGDRTAALRARPRPVIARVEAGATWLDLRTVHPDDDATVVDALTALGAAGVGGGGARGGGTDGGGG